MKHYIIFFLDNKVVDVHSFAEAEYEDFQRAIQWVSETIAENTPPYHGGFSIQTISC